MSALPKANSSASSSSAGLLDLGTSAFSDTLLESKSKWRKCKPGIGENNLHEKKE
jgi:hypothetical protein